MKPLVIAIGIAVLFALIIVKGVWAEPDQPSSCAHLYIIEDAYITVLSKPAKDGPAQEFIGYISIRLEKFDPHPIFTIYRHKPGEPIPDSTRFVTETIDAGMPRRDDQEDENPQQEITVFSVAFELRDVEGLRQSALLERKPANPPTASEQEWITRSPIIDVVYHGCTTPAQARVMLKYKNIDNTLMDSVIGLFKIISVFSCIIAGSYVFATLMSVLKHFSAN